MEKKTLGGFQLCILIINTIAVFILFQCFSPREVQSRETLTVKQPKWELVKTAKQQFVRSISRDPVTDKIWRIAETVKSFY